MGAADEALERAQRAGKERRLEDVRKHLLEAAELLRRDPDQLLRAQVLRRLGEVGRKLRQPEEARRYYEESIAVFRTLDEPGKLAHAIRHLGDVHRHRGSPESAEPCYTEALAIYRCLQGTAPLDLANAIRSLAVLRDETGASEEATRLWQEALDLYRGVRIPEGVAESAAHLALLAWGDNDPQRARDWLDVASTAAGESGDRETLQYIAEVRATLEG